MLKTGQAPHCWEHFSDCFDLGGQLNWNPVDFSTFTDTKMTTDLSYVTDVCNSMVATLQEVERIFRECMLQEEQEQEVEDTEEDFEDSEEEDANEIDVEVTEEDFEDE